MSLEQIITIIAFIMFGLGGICFFINIMTNSDTYIKIIPALILLGFLLLCIKEFIIPNMPQYQEVPTRDLSTYTAYLDGEEVDLDKIELSYYKVKYDDEKQIVYLTYKQNNDNMYIPIFIPSFK